MSPETPTRAAPLGISVLIAGAGVGGLMTALECWRRGCDVRILERSRHNIASGDSFTIGQTAINGLKHWPKLQKRNEEIAYNPMLVYCRQTGERVSEVMDFTDLTTKKIPVEVAVNRIYRHSRPKFHGILLDQLHDLGIDVEYDMHVDSYFEDVERGKAGVVLSDGSRHEADLIVAADGVRGNSWPLVAGKPIPARSSGDALFRTAYPIELALADPLVAERFKPLENGRSLVEMWVGGDITCLLWNSGDEMQWVISHKDDGSAAESWSHRASAEEVLKVTAKVPGWPELGDRLIKTAPPDSIVDWKLMWRDPQPKWTSPGGMVVQLGDAAHTFLPSSGNGATQAIEDGISLAACLTQAGSKARVPEATRVHNLLRFERVSCLQAFGVLNNRKNKTSVKGEKMDAKQQMHLGRWIYDHNPEKYAEDRYAEALAHLSSGTPFKNTNIPPNLTYRPWTIDGLLEAQAKGEPTVLDGDWD